MPDSIPETALILRDDAALKIAFTPEAERLKSLALEKAALIGKVTSAEEQAAAVEAQTELAKLISVANKARQEIKAPVIEFGRRIEDAVKGFLKEVSEEYARTGALVGDFQQLEQAKARAAEQARNEELTRLERERAEKLSQAKSHEALDAINEHYNRLAEQMPVHQPARVEGQRIAADWDVTVTDIHLLYRMHANCVELKPRLSEIKNLLKMGVKVNGVNAKPIIKAGIMIRKPKEINV